jgi:hypothetical protein
MVEFFLTLIGIYSALSYPSVILIVFFQSAFQIDFTQNTSVGKSREG